MRALDAMMSLLPRRKASAGKHEVARYTMTDFFNWQSMGFGGHQYGLGGNYGLNTTYGNRPVEAIGNSFEGYASGLLFCDGPVASAEAYRLRVFGQAPMLFQKRVAGRPGDYYDDDSLNLFRRPWMGGTCSDLMKRALIHGDLGGQAYIVEIDGELVLLRPDWVEIVLAKRMYEGYQVGWTQVGIAYYEGGVGVTSDPALFVAGEYIHFVPGMPDPLATYRGMSWLTPVIREIQADKGASDHKVKWFENAATPNLAVSLPKEVTPAQFNEFVEQMDAKHKGAVNAYKTLYTGGGADVTVIGADMQQMDFSNVTGKGETRIANAAGVPSTLLGFSEGMQGSSLNAGNYGPTKRNFVDTTGRDLWQNWCGSAEVLFPPPNDGDRLWYDPRDIPFLHEDQTDVATIKQIEASTMVSLVTAGFEKDSIIAATVAGDWSLLVDSGLVSVQLLPPGTTANDTAGESGPKAPAATAARAFNPAQLRDPHSGEWVDVPGVDLPDVIKILSTARGGARDVALIDDPHDTMLLGGGRFVMVGIEGHRSNWVKNGVDDAELIASAADAPAMAGALRNMGETARRGPNPSHDPDSGPILMGSARAAGFDLGAFYDPNGDLVAEGSHFVSVLTDSGTPPNWGEILNESDVVHLLVAQARALASAIDKVSPATRSADATRKFNPDQPRIPGGHEGGGQWGGIGGAMRDALKLAGRIDLDKDEHLLGSAKLDADFGGIRMALTEQHGLRTLRLGIGTEGFGKRDSESGIPAWSGSDDFSRINAERKALSDERERLEAEWDGANPQRRAQIDARTEEIEEHDTIELDFVGGSTAKLDEYSTDRLQSLIRPALDEAIEQTRAENAAWDELEALQAAGNPDPARVAQLRLLARADTIEAITFAKGIVPGSAWGDVHYEVYLDETPQGPQVSLGVKPKGTPDDWGNDKDWTADLDLAETRKFLRMLAQMSRQPVSNP